MRRFVFSALALSIAVAPIALEAQTPRAARAASGTGVAPHAGAGNPAARVLEHREALGLSLDQVRQLQQIQERVQQQNRPLIEQLQAAMPGMRGAVRQGMRPQMRQQAQQMTPEQREQMRAQMEARRADMETMRARMEAMREQMRTATPEERAAMRQEMQGRMPGQMQQRGMAGRGPGAAVRQANPELQAQLEALRPIREQVQANTRQARQDVRAVLTSQQQEQLTQLRQERRQEVRQQQQGMRERMGPAGRGTGAPPARRMLRGGAR